MTAGEKVPFCFLGRFPKVKKGALFSAGAQGIWAEEA